MTKWTYGPDGEAFSVAVGDVWVCGAHRFRCGSMMDEAVDVMADAATLVYADPPWNASLLHGYYTKAGLERPDFGWLDVYQRVFQLAGEKPCFVEGGEAQVGPVGTIVEQPSTWRWPITYNHRHPGVLFFAGAEPPRQGFDPSGLDDEVAPLAVMQMYPTGVVLDPCAGRGTTSRTAEEAGWSSLNNELNPNRLSAALVALSRMTGETPVREELADAQSEG